MGYRPPDVVSMPAHRLRRWPNIKPALFECLVLSGIFSTQAIHDTLAQCCSNVGPPSRGCANITPALCQRVVFGQAVYTTYRFSIDPHFFPSAVFFLVIFLRVCVPQASRPTCRKRERPKLGQTLGLYSLASCTVTVRSVTIDLIIYHV